MYVCMYVCNGNSEKWYNQQQVYYDNALKILYFGNKVISSTICKF